MRKYNSIILPIVIFCSTIFSVSCTKEDKIDVIIQKDYISNDIPNSSLAYEYDILSTNYYCNGSNCINVNDLDSNNLVSVVFNGNVYCFDNDSLFLQFCNDNGIASCYKYNKQLDLIYAKALELGIEDKEYEDSNDIPQEMKSYWRSVFGSDFGTINGDSTEAKFTWAITAYDGTQYSGSQKTLWGLTYWNLGNFNNKISSFKVYNTGVSGIYWCHKKWYGKPRVGYLLVGIPIGEIGCPYLNANNDNKFCSYFTIL